MLVKTSNYLSLVILIPSICAFVCCLPRAILNLFFVILNEGAITVDEGYSIFLARSQSKCVFWSDTLVLGVHPCVQWQKEGQYIGSSQLGLMECRTFAADLGLCVSQIVVCSTKSLIVLCPWLHRPPPMYNTRDFDEPRGRLFGNTAGDCLLVTLYLPAEHAEH